MNAGLISSSSDEWETPWHVFRRLDSEFGFTVDAAATADNAKCGRFWTKDDDALRKDWSGERVFCNPPYSRGSQRPFVEKAAELRADVSVLLIPARTDTAVWHELVFGKAEIRFVRGRLRFEIDGVATGSAPFPSAIVVFRGGE